MVSAPGVPRTERAVLVLAGLRLMVHAARPELLTSVVEMLSPPAHVDTEGSGGDWLLELAEGPVAEVTDHDSGLVLGLPYGGRTLSVSAIVGGAMRIQARYRPDAAAAAIDVDTLQRRTRLVVAPGDTVNVRWADWLARTFFASRLLADGWRMLHASAVAIDGRALVILADRHHGKSTLAHRAAAELQAHFMADDLVLIAPDGLVIGWPTRVGVPIGLLARTPSTGRREAREVNGVPRVRWLFTPREHRAALGLSYGPPAPLGAVVAVTAAEAGSATRARTLSRPALAEAVARAAAILDQTLYVTDVLGLMGGPPLAQLAAASRPVTEQLYRVPAAALETGDPAALGFAPAWDHLAPVLGLRLTGSP